MAEAGVSVNRAKDSSLTSVRKINSSICDWHHLSARPVRWDVERALRGLVDEGASCAIVGQSISRCARRTCGPRSGFELGRTVACRTRRLATALASEWKWWRDVCASEFRARSEFIQEERVAEDHACVFRDQRHGMSLECRPNYYFH